MKKYIAFIPDCPTSQQHQSGTPVLSREPIRPLIIQRACAYKEKYARLCSMRSMSNRKANCTLCTFYFADCFVKCFLIKLYCLALYGCCLWHLGSQSLHLLQTALNKTMRKVWHLPSRSHVPIVHCVAKTTSILRIIYG